MRKLIIFLIILKLYIMRKLIIFLIIPKYNLLKQIKIEYINITLFYFN